MGDHGGVGNEGGRSLGWGFLLQWDDRSGVGKGGDRLGWRLAREQRGHNLEIEGLNGTLHRKSQHDI